MAQRSSVICLLVSLSCGARIASKRGLKRSGSLWARRTRERRGCGCRACRLPWGREPLPCGRRFPSRCRSARARQAAALVKCAPSRRLIGIERPQEGGVDFLAAGYFSGSDGGTSRSIGVAAWFPSALGILQHREGAVRRSSRRRACPGLLEEGEAGTERALFLSGGSFSAISRARSGATRLSSSKTWTM